MQLHKLTQNYAYSGLAGVLFFAMIAVLYNNPGSDLEKRVSDLEDRVELLEEIVSGTDSVDTRVRIGVPHRDNWRQLQERMSMDEVKELLGEPNRVDGGRTTVWHYQTGGMIFFQRGRVSRWSEPY